MLGIDPIYVDAFRILENVDIMVSSFRLVKPTAEFCVLQQHFYLV